MLKSVIFFLLCIAYAGSINAETNVLLFAGSTRKESYNKQLVAEAARLAQQMGANVTVVDLKDYPIPFYDADLEMEEGMPENAKRLRRLMVQSQAIVISSPQYNRSVSAVLKNVLDWASRSEEGTPSREAFKGKKVAILSASPGSKGGAKGLIHLKDIVEDIGGIVLEQQLSLPKAHEAFDEQGNLKDEGAREQLRAIVSQLIN